MKIDGTLSDWFEVRSGLKQGDALSPVLWNIALESVFRNFKHRQQFFSRTGISLILAYADDIDVVGDSYDAVRGIFLQFQQDAKKIGLNINEDKTKYLHLTQYSSVRLPTKINKGSSIFERPLEFKYIGALITDDNEMRKEIHMRICNAWKSTHSLYSLLGPSFSAAP